MKFPQITSFPSILQEITSLFRAQNFKTTTKETYLGAYVSTSLSFLFLNIRHIVLTSASIYHIITCIKNLEKDSIISNPLSACYMLWPYYIFKFYYYNNNQQSMQITKSFSVS
jgi:hypothetical protein